MSSKSSGPAELLHQGAEEEGHVALVERQQHLFLAREVEVHRALGEAGGGGDFRDARHAPGVAQEEPLGGVEDLVAARLLVLGADGTLFQHSEMTVGQ
jgi:hypothetical protein